MYSISLYFSFIFSHLPFIISFRLNQGKSGFSCTLHLHKWLCWAPSHQAGTEYRHAPFYCTSLCRTSQMLYLLQIEGKTLHQPKGYHSLYGIWTYHISVVCLYTKEAVVETLLNLASPGHQEEASPRVYHIMHSWEFFTVIYKMRKWKQVYIPGFWQIKELSQPSAWFCSVGNLYSPFS